MAKVKGLIFYIVRDIVYLFSFLIPKNKNLWVFGAWFGEKYGDNSKYFFEHVNKNHRQIRAIWLCRNDETVKLVRSKGYEAYRAYSLKGIFLSMRAARGILSTGLYDINEFARGGMQLVQLWHGIALKKIMYDDTVYAKTPSLPQQIWHFLFPFNVNNYKKAILISTSQEVSSKWESAFRAPRENIKITGFPRNDIFFTNTPEPTPLAAKIRDYRKQGLKVGIYMPTHRRQGQVDMFGLFFENAAKIQVGLEKLGVVLLVKFHFYHLASLEAKDFAYKNLYFVRDNDINQDIYTVMGLTDFLITDYSSIYFDYLLTDKPLIFAPFDREDYLKNDRAFYYSYDDVTPGPKAANWEEVLRSIEETFKDPGRFAQDRARIKDMFHAFGDGESAERVFRVVEGKQ